MTAGFYKCVACGRRVQWIDSTDSFPLCPCGNFSNWTAVLIMTKADFDSAIRMFENAAKPIECPSFPWPFSTITAWWKRRKKTA